MTDLEAVLSWRLMSREQMMAKWFNNGSQSDDSGSNLGWEEFICVCVCVRQKSLCFIFKKKNYRTVSDS